MRARETFETAASPPALDWQGVWAGVTLAGLLIALSGCVGPPKQEAEAQSGSPGADQGPTPIDAAIARTGSLGEELEYTGTTGPVQEVSLRARVAGQLLSMNVDAGDPVSQGQVLAQLDDAQLAAAVNEAQAELAARNSEVASAQTQVSNAQTQVEQARLTLQQAQADSARSQQLLGQGAIAQQAAQLDQTEARTAAQALRSAQAQVRTQQQAVAAVQRRVAAQRAVIAQAKEQQSYTALVSPITGAVLERVIDSGNLVQPGNEILRLGDFSRVKVTTQISELELSDIRVGQPVQVRLDAFSNQRFSGQVTRISPAADPVARLLPVEVTIPNRDRRIGSGLLARVSFETGATQRVVVPETAISQPGPQTSNTAQAAPSRSTLFVVGAGNPVKVEARQVQVGKRANGQVEIRSGLKPGERFVARSGQPLKDGEVVRLSILSEPKGG